MPNDENFQREASREDPEGFKKLEDLTRELLKVKKKDLNEKPKSSPKPEATG